MKFLLRRHSLTRRLAKAVLLTSLISSWDTVWVNAEERLNPSNAIQLKASTAIIHTVFMGFLF
jgi:hypothetical protein